MDNVESGLLLGDEEHSATKRKVVGDEVGDRLRLAGAGRPMEDKRLAHRGIENGRKLRGVCGKRSEQLAVLDVRADFLGRKDLDAVVIVAAAFHKVRDERMAAKLVGAGGKILPHHELAEREVAYRGSLLDIPAIHALHRLAESGEDLCDVYARVIFGKRVEPRDGNPELRAEKLDERRIEHRVVVEAGDRISLANVLPRHLHGHQEYWRAALLGVSALLPPLEKPEREVERVYAAFLKVGLRKAEYLLEAAQHVI